MKRLTQLVLVISFVGFSWLAMQAVHELGHVLGAWMTGADIEKVVLHPLAISRTDISYNPRPLVEIWAGPLVGILLPLTVLLVAWRLRTPGLYLFRFFAAFCLAANGVYIGLDSFGGSGDAAELLHYGTPRYVLVAFGLAAFTAGMFLWNGLGSHFGFGEAKGRVERNAAIVSLTLFTLIVLVEVLVGSR